jgi:hypothetical protein
MAIIAWSKSECHNGFLHNYQIIRQSPGAVIEICEKCRDRQVFKINSGKHGNLHYLSYHLRQALPPFHRLYPHEYKKLDK